MEKSILIIRGRFGDAQEALDVVKSISNQIGQETIVWAIGDEKAKGSFELISLKRPTYRKMGEIKRLLYQLSKGKTIVATNIKNDDTI